MVSLFVFLFCSLLIIFGFILGVLIYKFDERFRKEVDENIVVKFLEHLRDKFGEL